MRAPAGEQRGFRAEASAGARMEPSGHARSRNKSVAVVFIASGEIHEMTVKEQQILPSAGSFVRYLGGFEHLHWLFSQSRPRAFAHAIEVTGTTTVKQWRAALDAKETTGSGLREAT